MKLPVHRWFRYSGGFSAAWVEEVLVEYNAKSIDPFVGSGTVCVTADKLNITSYGVEFKSIRFPTSKRELSWAENIGSKSAISELIVKSAMQVRDGVSLEDTPILVARCYSAENLKNL